MTRDFDAAVRERARWDARYAESGAKAPGAPSAWVIRRVLDHTQEGALVVDLAAGRGRHAIPLSRGRALRVVAVDFVERAVRAACGLRQTANAKTSGGVMVESGTGVLGVVADCAQLPLRDDIADAVICVNYLDRALMRDFARLLRRGGVLIVETFLAEQRRLGRGPSDPAHLLTPGELPTLIAPMELLEHREGLVRDEAGERYVAGVVARRRGLARGKHRPSATRSSSRGT